MIDEIVDERSNNSDNQNANDKINENIDVIDEELAIDWSKFETIKKRKFWSFSRRKVICFVHGFTSSFNSHEAVLQPFINDGYRFFAFNLPAHGKTQVEFSNSDLTINHFAKLVVQFIEFHNLRSVILVGHSMGGAISTIVLSMIRERIKCLILEDPLNRGAISSKEILKFFFRKAADGKMNIFHPIKAYRDSYKSDPNYKILLQNILTSQATKIIADAYEQIGDCPTLLIFGENDHVINPELSIKYIKTCAKNLTVEIIPNAAHSPSAQQPQLYYSAIKNFLDTLKKKKK